MENALQRYSLEKVKAMVEHQKSKYAWDFLFFGADIDAIGEAKSIGISADKAMRVCADAEGIECSYRFMSKFITDLRRK